jgi:hypothetical protein
VSAPRDTSHRDQPSDANCHYHRSLRLYPAAFRRGHEDELMAVLAAGAEDGRWRPGFHASLDLIRAAAWMRLRPGVPRSQRAVFSAVRLMYAGAVVELATLITVVATLDSLRAAIRQHHPHFDSAKWHLEMQVKIVPLEIGAVIGIAVWVWLAWANGRGHRWARVAFASFAALNVLSLLRGLAQHSATYAPADLLAGSILCMVAAAALVLIWSPQSRSHYAR